MIYYGILSACLLAQLHILANSNRAGECLEPRDRRLDLKSHCVRKGWLALTQLPVVFLFGTKNGLAGLLLGRGPEKLNIFHRWSGRGVFHDHY